MLLPFLRGEEKQVMDRIRNYHYKLSLDTRIFLFSSRVLLAVIDPEEVRAYESFVALSAMRKG